MEITTTQAVAAMQKEGGNGMQKLAACWIAMDEHNRARLERAFEPEFTKYRGVYADLMKVAEWKAAA
jgi:hypothetical protein